MDIKTVFENTTPEQRKNAFNCKTVEELGKFAKDEKVALSDEDAAKLFDAMHNNTGEISDNDLYNVAGGKGDTDAGGKIQQVCPRCSAKEYPEAGSSRLYLICSKCGHSWSVFDPQY